jgi:hypothetical protein
MTRHALLILGLSFMAGCFRGQPERAPSDSAHWRYDRTERDNVVSWSFTGDVLPPVELNGNHNTCSKDSINAVLAFLQIDAITDSQPELESLTRSRIDRAVWQWDAHPAGILRVYRIAHTIPKTMKRYDAISRVTLSK